MGCTFRSSNILSFLKSRSRNCKRKYWDTCHKSTTLGRYLKEWLTDWLAESLCRVIQTANDQVQMGSNLTCTMLQTFPSWKPEFVAVVCVFSWYIALLSYWNWNGKSNVTVLSCLLTGQGLEGLLVKIALVNRIVRHPLAHCFFCVFLDLFVHPHSTGIWVLELNHH